MARITKKVKEKAKAVWFKLLEIGFTIIGTVGTMLVIGVVGAICIIIATGCLVKCIPVGILLLAVMGVVGICIKIKELFSKKTKPIKGSWQDEVRNLEEDIMTNIKDAVKHEISETVDEVVDEYFDEDE